MIPPGSAAGRARGGYFGGFPDDSTRLGAPGFGRWRIRIETYPNRPRPVNLANVIPCHGAGRALERRRAWPDRRRRITAAKRLTRLRRARGEL